MFFFPRFFIAAAETRNIVRNRQSATTIVTNRVKTIRTAEDITTTTEIRITITKVATIKTSTAAAANIQRHRATEIGIITSQRREDKICFKDNHRHIKLIKLQF